MSKAINSSRPEREDIFSAAVAAFSIADAWRMLGYEGEPKRACKSPFREDRTPSFSIHNDGKSWKDHATGDGGDVVEFVKLAVGGYAEARDWLKERIGMGGALKSEDTPPQSRTKQIKWPSELVEGQNATRIKFAHRRGFSPTSSQIMVTAGLLRFSIVDGNKCFVITDESRRAAEIRRIDGQPFGKSKAYPLRGVDKTWLPGADLLRIASPDVGVLVTEGATDFLTAIDLYVRYRRGKLGHKRWVIVAILGASCKTLDGECATLIRGRHVRLAPDADDAGDAMTSHWRGVFNQLGCPVDAVTLPRGKDLTDCKAEIKPEDLFNV
jgi:hypothetical protein